MELGRTLNRFGYPTSGGEMVELVMYSFSAMRFILMWVGAMSVIGFVLKIK